MGFPFLVMMSHLRPPGSFLAVEEKDVNCIVFKMLYI